MSVCDEATYLNTLALGLRLPTTLAQEIRGAVSGTWTRFVSSSVAHLDENVAAARILLSTEDLHELAAEPAGLVKLSRVYVDSLFR